MDASVGKIRKGRKYDQVVDGARDVFLRDGFDGASVDDIARAAGVSKATLYSYFPDKQLLFMEVARLQCREQADEAITHLDRTLDTETLFRNAGLAFLDIVFSPMAIENFRMCLAEAERFPALAEEFWRCGPLRFLEGMDMLFDVAIARGDLEVSSRIGLDRPDRRNAGIVRPFRQGHPEGLAIHVVPPIGLVHDPLSQ